MAMGITRLGPTDGESWCILLMACFSRTGSVVAGCFPAAAARPTLSRAAARRLPDGGMARRRPSSAAYGGHAGIPPGGGTIPRAPIRPSSSLSVHSCRGSEGGDLPAWLDPPASASSKRASAAPSSLSPTASSPSEPGRSASRIRGFGPSWVCLLRNSYSWPDA